jgi:putative ABC transport system permease protein
VIGSSIRALARVARRDVVRHRGRSVLVIALVGLPVAAMVAGTALYRTTTPTQERSDTAQFGNADLLAYNTTRSELETYLPPGSVVEASVSGTATLLRPGARSDVTVRAMDIEGLAAGILTLVDGRAPEGAGEVAITKAVAQLAAVGIGGRLELAERPPLMVVGLVENPMHLVDQALVVDPTSVVIDDDGFATWLIGLPAGTDPEAVVASTMDPVTGEQEIQITSRESGRLQQIGEDSTGGTILILGSLALVEAALIASAAFAVSIRRRQRELGLLAATGASPRQLAGTVLLQGVILGLAACVAGVVVGVAGALGLTPWLDDLTQRRNPSLVVDVAGILGPIVVGFVAAMIAAAIPARTVARVPVLLALSGRRPSQTPARRTLWFGLGAVGLSAAMTVIGATMRDAGNSSVSILLLLGGAVLSTLGFGACAPWLLERLERLAVRLPLASRIAFRDTARSRSRSAPIVTAILAGCAAAIALGAWQTSRDEENILGWRPSLYEDQLVLSGPGAREAGEELRGEPGVIDGMSIPFLGLNDPEVFLAFQLPDALDDQGKVINLIDQCGNCNPDAFEPYQVYRPAAGTPEVLAMARAESAAADLAKGHAVVLSFRATTATKLDIVIQRDPENLDPPEVLTLPVRVIPVPVPGGHLPDLLLPDATIRELGLGPIDYGPGAEFGPPEYILRYDRAVTQADLAHAREVASRFADTHALIDTPPVRPGAEFRIVLIALVLLFAVSVTGIAIALGEAESRPEQRSLLAIGADPRLRRRIAASRAAVLALLAGLLAVPAGLLPIWGIFASRGSPLAVPTIEIIGAIVLLPLLAVISAFLLSRPIPDWNAFRNVRPGE